MSNEADELTIPATKNWRPFIIYENIFLLRTMSVVSITETSIQTIAGYNN
jgi:hypothetical protein